MQIFPIWMSYLSFASLLCISDMMYGCINLMLCVPAPVRACASACLKGMKLTPILSRLRQMHCSARRHRHGNKPVSLGTRQKAKIELYRRREKETQAEIKGTKRGKKP